MRRRVLLSAAAMESMAVIVTTTRNGLRYSAMRRRLNVLYVNSKIC